MSQKISSTKQHFIILNYKKLYYALYLLFAFEYLYLACKNVRLSIINMQSVRRIEAKEKRDPYKLNIYLFN